MIGCFVLGFDAVPDLKNFLEEELYHVETTCHLISGNKTEVRDCTYIENCGDDCTRERKISFQCLRVWVSHKDSNSNIIITEMFRSYQDAVKTDFECSAYECVDSSKIFEYFREVNEVKKFQCFYHPERLEYAYFGTANHSLVIFTFVFEILLILIPVTIFCCIFIKINKELQCCPKVSCWKTREKIGRLHTFTYCHSNSRDHVTRSLENGSYKICKRLVKKTNVNRELFIYGTELSPLGVAANYGHIKIMDYLVSIGASLNYVHLSEQKGIFHLACDSESEDAIKWCIDKKLPINQIDSSHRSPLSSYLITVPSLSLPLLKRMIDAGADVNTGF